MAAHDPDRPRADRPDPDRTTRGWLAATVVLGGVLGLGLAVKVGCAAGGLTLGELWIPGCYADVVAIAQARGLDADPLPYRDFTTEYPPLTALQWVVAMMTSSTTTGFLLATAAMAAVAMLVQPWLLVRLGARPRDLWPFVAAPTVGLLWVVSWDAVPVALLLAAVLAHRRDRHGLSGVLVGLGALAKVFPAVLVVPVLLALRARGHPAAARRHLFGFGATVAVGLLVVLPWAGDGLWAMVRLNGERTADWDTVWYGAFVLAGRSLGVPAVNLLTTAAMVLGAAVILLRGRGLSPTRRWELVLPLLLWVLLAGKVWSPQYSLWVLPLMVLLVPDRRLVWAFVATDLAVVLTRFPFLAGQEGLTPALPYGVFGAAVAARALVVLALLAASPTDGPTDKPTKERADPDPTAAVTPRE